MLGQAIKKQEVTCKLRSTWFLLCIRLDPEDGEVTFLQNVGELYRTARCYVLEDNKPILHSYELSEVFTPSESTWPEDLIQL
jgi:hypothetical protein